LAAFAAAAVGAAGPALAKRQTKLRAIARKHPRRIARSDRRTRIVGGEVVEAAAQRIDGAVALLDAGARTPPEAIALATTVDRDPLAGVGEPFALKVDALARARAKPTRAAAAVGATLLAGASRLAAGGHTDARDTNLGLRAAPAGAIAAVGAALFAGALGFADHTLILFAAKARAAGAAGAAAAIIAALFAGAGLLAHLALPFQAAAPHRALPARASAAVVAAGLALARGDTTRGQLGARFAATFATISLDGAVVGAGADTLTAAARGGIATRAHTRAHRAGALDTHLVLLTLAAAPAAAVRPA
jgi:hypothetical protein